jgi:hypothetical protein
MMSDELQLFANAQAYAKGNGRRLSSKASLGRGTDGSVWQSTRPSAIKAIREKKTFDDELECYRRLQAAGIRQLCGLAVPWLFGADDSLRVIEISIVQPPYLLDFGKVYFAEPQDVYDRRKMAAAESEARALFGPKWQDVNDLLYTLRERFGIWYIDPKPANIDFGVVDDPDWDKEPGIDYSEYEQEADES